MRAAVSHVYFSVYSMLVIRRTVAIVELVMAYCKHQQGTASRADKADRARHLRLVPRASYGPRERPSAPDW